LKKASGHSQYAITWNGRLKEHQALYHRARSRSLTEMDFDVFQELSNGVEDDEDQHCQILV
jgi:hypothetical protein